MTSSNGNIFHITGLCEGNPPVTDWVNNLDAGDLRRRRTHYDVTVVQLGKAIDPTTIAVVFHTHEV